MTSELSDSGLRRFMDNSAQCPAADVLQLALNANTDAQIVAALTDHLDGCPACCERLEQLAIVGSDTVGSDTVVESSAACRPIIPPRERLLSNSGMSDSASIAKNTAVGSDTNSNEAADGAAMVALDFLKPSDKPGVLGLLADYEIREVLGQGGMGIVLRALDPKLGREVALKVLLPELATNRTGCERFVREARAAAANNHENIVTVYSVNDVANPPFFVMELIEGESLHERLARCGTLPADEVVSIAMQVASALAAAHENEMVHRDVKPANILVSPDGSVHLGDFGLVKVIDDVGITRTGVIAGTPEFMSPEQAEDQTVDFRSDLFGLGAVMYQALVGESPFRASTAPATLRRVCEHDPPSPRQVSRAVPRWLSDTVQRLLEKDPADRVPSAQALVSALTSQQAPANVRSIRRKAGVAVLLVAGLAMLWVFGPNAKKTWQQAGREDVLTVAPVPGSGFVNARTQQAFQSLSLAASAAEDGDLIQVWIDGEVPIEPVLIYGKSLTIEAAPECRPVLLADAQAYRVPAISSDSNLTLNQLHFRWSGVAPEDSPVRTTVRLDGAGLRANDCSFVCEDMRRVAIRVENGNLELKRCELKVTDTVCINWVPGADATAAITGCTIEGYIGLSTSSDKYGSQITLSNNSWQCTATILVRASAEPEHRLMVIASRNNFSSDALLAFRIKTSSDESQLVVVDDNYLQRMIQWSDIDNNYANLEMFSSRALEAAPYRLEPFGPQTTEDWLAMWR